MVLLLLLELLLLVFRAEVLLIVVDVLEGGVFSPHDCAEHQTVNDSRGSSEESTDFSGKALHGFALFMTNQDKLHWEIEEARCANEDQEARDQESHGTGVKLPFLPLRRVVSPECRIYVVKILVWESESVHLTPSPFEKQQAKNRVQKQ